MSIATLAPARSIPADPQQPGPGTVQDHIRRLRECGGTYRSIAAAAGLAPATVYYLASGRSATPYTTTALLAVTSETLPCYRVDAGGTRLRLRALHVMGHGSARIARAVGVQQETIRKLVRGDTMTISPRLRDAIAAVYDAWWDKRAPARNRFERSAATVARKRAIAGNWCAAAALDDNELDTPGYRPRWGWKPATGTGTADDMDPPALQKRRDTTDNQMTHAAARDSGLTA
jgi:transcriptional regulator with XRE-family HTH domain